MLVLGVWLLVELGLAFRVLALDFPDVLPRIYDISILIDRVLVPAALADDPAGGQDVLDGPAPFRALGLDCPGEDTAVLVDREPPLALRVRALDLPRREMLTVPLAEGACGVDEALRLPGPAFGIDLEGPVALADDPLRQFRLHELVDHAAVPVGVRALHLDVEDAAVLAQDEPSAAVAVGLGIRGVLAL